MTELDQCSSVLQRQIFLSAETFLRLSISLPPSRPSLCFHLVSRRHLPRTECHVHNGKGASFSVFPARVDVAVLNDWLVSLQTETGFLFISVPRSEMAICKSLLSSRTASQPLAFSKRTITPIKKKSTFSTPPTLSSLFLLLMPRSRHLQNFLFEPSHM